MQIAPSKSLTTWAGSTIEVQHVAWSMQRFICLVYTVTRPCSSTRMACWLILVAAQDRIRYECTSVHDKTQRAVPG